MTDPLVYRAKDVAALFQVSTAHVYRSIKVGAIPSVRVGHSVRVPRWWVEEKLKGRAA